MSFAWAGLGVLFALALGAGVHGELREHREAVEAKIEREQIAAVNAEFE